eukprot:maker-scaffold200_size264178-snap-gene-0.9 protein:Tk07732 transcript:maker-scaffold200_size264178-snap-gene-0.9-mRNA-1 annotation:"atp-binding cassette sub-family a member 5"
MNSFTLGLRLDDDPDRIRRVRDNVDDADFLGPDFETIPSRMLGQEAIVINNLKKTFKSMGKPPVEAVRGVSLKVYPGEITAILGHNGAGKTTLFNMLTGMTSTTSGTADIFGFDVADDNQMEEIRKMTGICPQHDVLFDELTPREHLTFFARIRGMSEDEIPEEVDSILKDISLEDKADSVAVNLSGGQKRKLSVGIALIGDPKIIFLDEPTAGVDPYSRRHMWSLLKERKEGKVILLTTHFMDEADILADRKAIVSQGKVRCYGSSLFLKTKFGVGYHLTLVLEPNGNLQGIRDLIRQYVPDAEQNRLFGRELAFVLPREDVDRFPELFTAIENDMDHHRLGISSYGVSMTTLEEIFLKLGEEEEVKKEVAELKKMGVETKVSNCMALDGNEGNVHLNDVAQPVRMSNNKNDKDMDGFSFEALATKKSKWQMFWALTWGLDGNEGNVHLNDVAQPVRMSNNKNDKDMDGFSFEALATKKSKWQMFWALTWVRFVRKYREPVALLVQMVMPLVFLILGIWLTTISSVGTTQEDPIAIHPSFYDGANQPPGGWEIFSILNSANFDFGSFGGTIFIGFTYVLIPIGLALELIEDREIRARNQLRVNGLTFGLYYGSFYLVLGGMMLIILAALLLLVWAFDIAPLTLPPAFLTLGLIYLIYTPASLLFSSTISYMFDKVENGQFLFPIASYVGFIPYIAVSLLDMFQVADGLVGKICHVVFAFLSPIYIPFGAVYYINRQFVFNLCGITSDCSQLTFADYMGEYEIYSLFIACVFHIVLWFFLLKVVDVLKDGGSFKDALGSFMGNKEKKYETLGNDHENVDSIVDEDVDVLKERNAVNEYMRNQGEERVVAVKGLRKQFQTNEGKPRKGCTKKTGDVEEKEVSKTKIAVRNLTMGVQEGEVFGLLGHNGAGKTTTMRIITAEEAPTSGQVKIGKYNITSNASPGFEMLGYCPQFDAVWRTITVREHLQVYAAIRGIPKKEIGRLADQFMDGLRIQEHANKYAKDCSGGTKRKLSYAMAMLGDPKIVLLDEPSTGMDPQSKRFVWDTVLASFKKDRGAILTTHSMEEADALCTRVGIMVKGELRCLGSTQHLKNRYGSGYVLEVKLRHIGGPDSSGDVAWTELEDAIQSKFPGAELQEKFADRRTHSIPQTAFSSLASAFRSLESLKNTHDIEEYSFGQTTLEQVFLEFAKQQEAADDDDENGTTDFDLLASQQRTGRSGSVLPITEL